MQLLAQVPEVGGGGAVPPGTVVGGGAGNFAPQLPPAGALANPSASSAVAPIYSWVLPNVDLPPEMMSPMDQCCA